MKLISAATLASCAILSTALSAQDRTVVVELFTSQGCASCPPADAILHGLSEQDDVIALALHVDYWDYIGWKDRYALASHTKRQRGYAHKAGRDMIYTPQMIVNGIDDVVGAHADEVAEIIEREKSTPAVATLTADRSGSQLSIHAAPVAKPLAGPITVQVVRYAPLKTAQITRGENAGHELDYANVVEDWILLGEWDGAGPYQAQTELDGDLPTVVLLQYAGPGAIVAAARAK
ncbi:DUF1223 domain-containing protein [Sedimentitalea todarodis]|uniref:DUF1223 domain-containing protein n=1 Tax=Sedimentitalea todarodis TaxID=1631240 RepID=A0ABU3VBN2_9RHOB|nr:DUF1223 domain-containing protein [Sedimentitalea todarodis]MDU9003582.1 DUF1223 domain-containing protein [Sedimentitalea todarodis]